jgi:hypothetical protein
MSKVDSTLPIAIAIAIAGAGHTGLRLLYHFLLIIFALRTTS